MDCGHGWRNDNDCDVCRPPAVVVAGLRGRIAELEAALMKEWQVNHSEHCQNQWPHDGVCHWPMPDCLQAR